MKQDKYYTPTIDEFHVGFEFERRELEELYGEITYSDKWIEHEYDKDTSLDYLNMTMTNSRVKYLDKEDIKELGFKTIIKNNMIYCQYGNEDIYLDYNLDTNYCKIHTMDDILFLGFIKNKSELKVLLKQLGI